MSEQSPYTGGAGGSLTAAQGRQLSHIAEAVARWCVYLSVLLIPLFYLPWTIDGLELPKQFMLAALAVVGTLTWLGKMLVERRVEFRRSPMNLLVGVYLIIYALAARQSKSRYASFIGDYGQEKAGFLTVVCFALLYFVATNVIRGTKQVRAVLNFALLGSLLTLLEAYLQAFGLRFLPGSAAQSSAFNLIGTSNALGVYAGAAAVMMMGLLLMPEEGKWKLPRRVLMGILGVLALFYVAALDFWGLWLVVVISAGVLVAYGMAKTDKVKQVSMLAIPMALVVIGVLFIFIRFPISLGTPAEVMPSMRASWNIAREALASQPLLGSGPGTFLYDYAQFRSKDLNGTQFWSVHFDRSSSRLLTILATTGILGLASFLVLALYLMGRTALRLWRGHDEWLLTLAVFAGWVALLAGKIFYSSNMTLEFLFWMLTALLVILEWDRWQEAKFENSPRAALTLSFCFIVAIIFSVAGLYLEGQRYVAERYYSQAITRNLQKPADVDASVNDLIRATQLNAQNDLYYRTLSQALTLKTNLEIQRVGNKPTQDDSRNIAVLAANAVNAGKAATDLNPVNVDDWASLASLYGDLVGSTPGAADAAQNAYAKAIALEPSNPVHYAELGKVLLTMAEADAPRLQGKDETDKAAAKKEINDFLSKAKDNLDKAVTLKPDYAPAHYWMALVLRDMGQTAEAVKRLEIVRASNPNDLGVGFQLAIMYYQNNQKDKAITELERVVALSPQYSNARWYLSAMYEEAGRLDDAIAQVQEVLKYNKDSDTVKQRLDALTAKKAGQPAPAQPGLPNPIAPPAPAQVIPPKK